ncbi:VCBS repeat-containing protein [Pseudodesulfovibrio sp. zrk46]|uniref:FG-GAP repeat domain-containing protein n=1 Tax=Pseudodesulfovibrio sp. zrk46 TaxID=2725288 RepID=UPI00144986D3|nr:VCBS repeat-containing protein [Pseudodesulfovibrio sp. zrk46]QJB56632.1 VCBS repeat-containing protein [Pseudodesulfovibrio sp. zrk46]
MFQRRLTVILTATLALMLMAGTAMAQGAKKYAVTPFEYNGPKKFSYFPKAFQASLNSDLEWPGHAESAPDSLVEELKAPTSQGEAINTMRASGLDYIVTGTIAILDKEATLSMKAYGVDGSSWTQKGQMGIDEITPWLDEQSKAIMGEVFHRPGYSTTDQEVKAEKTKDIVQTGPTNPQFIQAEEREFSAASLNPQFRYEGGTGSVGRWRSQTLRFNSSNMVVGDVNGDGKNEVVLLTNVGISVYVFENGKLKHLDNLEVAPKTQFLRAELMDLDGDNIPEIIVGSIQTYSRKKLLAPEITVKSHILSFKKGKLEYLLKNYRKFLGVLRTPPTYSPVLVVQDKGEPQVFTNKINEAIFKNGDITKGPAIPRPEYANIYNMTYLPDGFGYKVIVLDDYHRIKVYDQTLEKLSSSDVDRYNSSGIGVEYSERLAGMGPGMGDGKIATYNVPFRMITAPLSKKNQYELLVNKDLSIAAQVFERFTYFSQGEIHSLAWDGVGMNLAWKTRRIKGQVSDVALADINNDGKDQLVVLLNTFPGGMGFTNRKTVVLAYDLNM